MRFEITLALNTDNKKKAIDKIAKVLKETDISAEITHADIFREYGTVTWMPEDVQSIRAHWSIKTGVKRLC